MTTNGAVQLDELKAQYAILEYCRGKRAELDEMAENARAAIEAALGDNEEGTIDGRVAVRWKRFTRRSLDIKALKDAEPDTYESYTKISETRRFELVGGDE